MFARAETYLLLAKYLGANISGERLKNRVIPHNGFRFKIMTFKDEIAGEVQLYMLSSYLEQAVGRARGLNHDVTVHVFSGFPCEQAEFIHDDCLTEETDAPALDAPATI